MASVAHDFDDMVASSIRVDVERYTIAADDDGEQVQAGSERPAVSPRAGSTARQATSRV